MTIVERDTGQQIWFEKSNPALSGRFLGLLIFVGLAVRALNGSLPVENTSKITLLVISWATIILFGFVSLLYLKYLLFLPRWVVKLTASGFIDHRILRMEIPWSKVASVKMFTAKYNSFVNVTFTPSFAGSAGLKRRSISLFRLGRRKQLLISPVGVQATKAELLHSFQTYHERYATQTAGQTATQPSNDGAVLQTQGRP